MNYVIFYVNRVDLENIFAIKMGTYVFRLSTWDIGLLIVKLSISLDVRTLWKIVKYSCWIEINTYYPKNMLPIKCSTTVIIYTTIVQLLTWKVLNIDIHLGFFLIFKHWAILGYQKINKKEQFRMRMNRPKHGTLQESENQIRNGSNKEQTECEHGI